MDQLKQIQKYQFWILLGVALILPLVGWTMARSGLVDEATKREKEITGLLGNLKAGPDDPNTEWQKNLAFKNKDQEGQKRQAWEELFSQQKNLMTWPKRLKFGDDPTKASNEDLDVYRISYKNERARVYKIVKPIDDNGDGLVEFPDTLLPAPDDEWLTQPPTIKQMVAAQEDIWLLTSLLEALAKVNEGATSQLDAPLVLIEDLRLMGGGAKSGGGGANKAVGGGGGGGAVGGTKDIPAGEGFGGGVREFGGGRARGGGGVEGAQGGLPDAGFNYEDEIGAEQEEKSEPGSGGGGGGAAKGTPPGGGGGGLGNTGGNSGGSKPMDRYVDKREEWKTRGFYMRLVIDHRRLPELLAALANAEFPTKVLRVHQVDYRDEDLAPADSGSMAAGGSPGAAGAFASRPFGVGAGSSGGGAPGSVGGAPGMGGRGGAPGMSSAKGGMNSALGGARSGGGRSSTPSRRITGDEEGSAAAMNRVPGVYENPNLANIALDGVITIFNKPSEQPASQVQQPPPTAGQPQPAAAAAGTAGSSQAAGAAANGTANTADTKAADNGSAADTDETTESEPAAEMPAEEPASDEPAEPGDASTEEESPPEKER